MLIVGYLYGIRSETRLGQEVHLNLAYRWFCKLGLDGRVPDRSTFSKNRYDRFAEGDVLRSVFELVVKQCMSQEIVAAKVMLERSKGYGFTPKSLAADKAYGTSPFLRLARRPVHPRTGPDQANGRKVYP